MINYYGVMPDAINAGDETDRIVLHWELASDRVRAACDGTLRQAQGNVDGVQGKVDGVQGNVDGAQGRPDVSLVEIPADIERLRRTDPATAHEWRLRVRDQLTGALAAGGRIIDFDRVRGGYLITEGQA